ncbi:carbohydrate ABC transporter permease [Streptomyces sp. Li-HN-5-11]|uniref:carbohydrate ABC transporter permease n=1 Tax=Streptomyces sp. Li-HN-5-11 TaxID=3075432 RepID=UPI0028AF8170|nr:carbohydrate ABC transporter permease [Streptomyces sp. Li-HN-5-11]WNM31974.1 carbohydrate ABC transporter permease [Streptomyces sp. Li-HN-5-11]
MTAATAAPAGPAAVASPRRARSVSLTSRTGAFAVMALFALYTLVPVWWLLVTATKNKGYLFTTNPLWFSHFDLWNNILDVFHQQDGIFARWMLNSVIYCVGGAAASTLLSAMAGYALAKFSFRGRELAFNIVLGAVLVPSVMFALPLYLMFSEIHLVNTYWAVLLPSMASPFGVYLSRVYAAASVPDEMLEAGRVDGASEARIFWRIAIPIMLPALVTVFLFQFVVVWNNYLLPVLMLNNDALQPVTVGLANWREQMNGGIPYNVTVTGAFLSVFPLIIAFLALQRFWRSGLAAGSVK